MNWNRPAAVVVADCLPWTGIGPEPEILLHPPIPLPMFGLAPRVVMDAQWWAKVKAEAYAQYNYTCAACGIPKETAPFRKWLEAHECYTIDYQQGRMNYVKTVALCHACHNYIHRARLDAMCELGQISKEKRAAIIRRGDGVLERAGLLMEKMAAEITANSTCHQIDAVPWGDWRLVVDGMEFPPRFNSKLAMELHYEIENEQKKKSKHENKN